MNDRHPLGYTARMQAIRRACENTAAAGLILIAVATVALLVCLR